MFRLAHAVRAGLAAVAVTTLASGVAASTPTVSPAPSVENFGDVDTLGALQRRFPALSAFHVTSGQIAATLRTTDTIQSAYESGGKLYFITMPGASDGIETLHALSDGIMRTVPLTPGGFRTLYFLDWTKTARSAVLEGSRAAENKTYDWTLADARLRRRSGTVRAPHTWRGDPQPQSPATCTIRDKGVTFIGSDGQHDVTISTRTLGRATHGIAFQDGVTIGCRRVGPSKLIWLTRDAYSDDGVTYAVVGSALEPLFSAHPNITTTHFLMFSQVEGTGPMREYLFLSDVGND